MNSNLQKQKEIIPHINGAKVVASPLPFSNKQIKLGTAPGQTVMQIIDQIVPDHHKLSDVGAVVFINGEFVPQMDWHKTTPAMGELVNVRIVPTGGGGKKNPLVSLLSIAILVAAPYLAGAALGAVGISATAQIGIGTLTYGGVLSSAIGVVGRLALSALAPPPKPSNAGQGNISNPAESPTQFIEGAKNSLNPYGVVPICLGINRMFPLQAARPYTETENNEQFVRQLFTYGYGPKMAISERKIGETDLDEFSEYDLEDRLDGNLHDAPSIFSNDVFQEDMNVVLEKADGYTTRTTQPNANEVIIDITFPRGLARYDDQGKRGGYIVELEAQYALVGQDPQVWSTGAAEYKAIAATSAGFTPPELRGYNRQTGQSERIDVVAIDKFTERVVVIKGEEGFQPKRPSIGTTRFAIAQVSITRIKKPDTYTFGVLDPASDTTTISVADIRNPSKFGDELFDENSFVPTKNGNRVEISAGEIRLNEFLIRGNQSEALRRSSRVILPEVGQYDVRVRRLTSNSNDDQIFDDSVLTAIKTVRHQSPVNLEGLNGTAMRIKATDQLNGALDQYNVIAASIIPDYDVDDDEWIEKITNNPASIFRYVLQGAANAKPLEDSKIALDEIEAWHQHCENENYTYNRVIDYETSVDEILRDVCAAGAASPAIVDGKRTVVVDQIKTEPTQMFTPRNSWAYTGEFLYPDMPHGFRVTFRNKDAGYVQDERIVYDDEYDESNATIFEGMELQSCTDSDLAFKTARRHIASVRLRPETHTFMTDIENLVSLRGDRILFEHDIPIIGVGDARIKKVILSGDDPDTVLGVKLDDTITIPKDAKFCMRVRLDDGTYLYESIVTTVGYYKEFYFTTPLAIEDTPAKGDLCYVVEAGGELDLVITKIEPQEDLTARVTAINYDENIFVAENVEIPPFNSFITTPLEFIRPEPPILLDDQSDEGVMLLNSDGSFTPRAIFTLENQNENEIDTTVKVRVSGTTQFTNANVLESTPERLVLTGLEDGTRYDIHIRYRRRGGTMFSNALELNNYLFIGASGLPDNVANFTVKVNNGTAFFKWDSNTDIDFKHYKVKYSNVYSGATWATAQTLEDEIKDNRLTVPFLGGTYLIKAVDLTGNESETATAIITYNPGLVENTVELIEEAPEFLGLKDNVVQDSGKIIMATTALGVGYYYIEKTVDLTGVFPSFLSATLVANGIFANDLFAVEDLFASDDLFGSGGNDLFAVEDLFASDDLFGIGLDGWAVGLEYRTIQTTPQLTHPTNNLADVDYDGYSDTRGEITTYDSKDPMGYNNAHTFTEDTADGQHYIRPEHDIPLDIEHTFSFYLKSETRWVRILIRDDDDTSNYFYIHLNLQTGENLFELAQGNATLSNISIEPSVGGFWRVKMTGVVNSAGGTRVRTYIYSAEPTGFAGEISYAGDDESGFEFYGFEIVTGDTAYSPVWGEWLDFAAGTVEFWGIQFRLKMESLAQFVSPQVTKLNVQVDMPDRIERGEDLIVPTAGLDIDFSPAFKATPTVVATIQNSNDTDDIEEITNKTAGGFTIKVYNKTAGDYVERSIDYVASGYGRKNT